ncbi:MAG: glycosyltransferase [Bacteroidales bacterium]|jgi:glycosyltransferase involved in cell wall biosynthesis
MGLKVKVLLVTNYITHYNLPLYERLGSMYDLTVIYSCGEFKNKDTHFSYKYISTYKFKRFNIYKKYIGKICKQFDVVIFFGDIAYLNNTFIILNKHRSYKVIIWGIGVSASYDKKFDEVTKWDHVRNFIYKRADANIFYSEYPIQKYIEAGFDKQTLFVANNTLEVDPYIEGIEKDSILFIGTLYIQKGIKTLLEQYKKAYDMNHYIPIFNIVGGGTDYDLVVKWINENNLSDKIKVHGSIYDLNTKRIFFERAYATISPMQAGLSVLESMGYGTPFVTMHDAITGGERFNIEHNKNGILMKNIEEISEIIIDITNNPNKYIHFGINAKEYYYSCRTIDHMTNEFRNAIDYVLNKV